MSEESLSDCRVLNPRDELGVDLSDHLPVSCRFGEILGSREVV